MKFIGNIMQFELYQDRMKPDNLGHTSFLLNGIHKINDNQALNQALNKI